VVYTLAKLQKLNIIPKNWVYNETQSNFAIKITNHYLDLMDFGNENDPLLRQVIPHPLELNYNQSGLIDPIGDDKKKVTDNLIHRYRNKVLLLTNSNCPANCRFCFRRNMLIESPYRNMLKDEIKLKKTLTYIRKHEEIDEVILSGGEPLSLPITELKSILIQLSQIENIKVIRIHSRLLAFDPERLNKNLCQLLNNIKSKLIIVHHLNHKKEVSDKALDSLKLLKPSIKHLSHTVLLKNINNNVRTLKELYEKLFFNGITPYYLFVTDYVLGASHFMINISEAQDLYKTLKKSSSNYLMPRLILDQPEAFGKINIEPPEYRIIGKNIKILSRKGIFNKTQLIFN